MPSDRTLCNLLDLSPRDAAILRDELIASQYEFGRPEMAMELANRLMKMYGVEYISEEGDLYRTEGIYYVNTGDAYGITLTYDNVDRLYRVTSYGDLIEILTQRGRNFV